MNDFVLREHRSLTAARYQSLQDIIGNGKFYAKCQTNKNNSKFRLFVCLFGLNCFEVACCSEFYCVRRWTLVHRLTHRSEQDLHWNNDPIANNTSWLLSAKTFRVLSCSTHDLYEQRMSYEVGNDSTLAVIHKWLPIHYSFVLVQISLPSLIVMSKIEKNYCSKAVSYTHLTLPTKLEV